MKFKEIEVKHAADNIKLSDFIQLVESFKPLKRRDVSSWDFYYSKGQDFIRYRNKEDSGELTIKRKTTELNNNNRVEVNLKLADNSQETVDLYAKLEGYDLNFKIYKNCFIFFFDKINTVFYTVNNEDMTNFDSYLEIEANDWYPWTSEEEAWNEVIEWENKLKSLGISPQSRLKLSLWERYRKT